MFAKQESPVDLLDVDAAVLHGLDAIGDLKELAGGSFGIGVRAAVMLMFSLSRSGSRKFLGLTRYFDN